MQRFLDALYGVFAKILPKKIISPLRQFFTKAFITFLVIGVINTLSTAIISTLLDIGYNAAGLTRYAIIERFRLTFILGYALSMIISFLLNCRLTFNEKPTLKKLIRFPVSYIPNFIIQYLVVWFCASVFTLPPTIAYLAAAVIGIPVTFITMKLFVFSKK